MKNPVTLLIDHSPGDASNAIAAACFEVESWGVINSARLVQVDECRWRGVVDPDRFGMRAAVALQAFLLADGHDARIAVVFDGSTDEPTGLITVAGREDLKGQALLIGATIRRWTKAKAAAVALSLNPTRPRTHSEVGEILGKSRQSVAKALHAAWGNEIRHSLDALEKDEAWLIQSSDAKRAE